MDRCGEPCSGAFPIEMNVLVVNFPGKTMKDQISDPLSLRGVAHQWWVDTVQCRESLKGFYCSGAQSSLVWVFVRK